MDPVNPVPENSEAANIEEKVEKKEPENMNQKKTGNTLTVVGVAIFILLSLGVVAFLYYQNQQLKKMLLEVKATPVPTEVPVVSETPSETPSATPVQKSKIPAGWSTYKNTDYGFEISYPEGYKEVDDKYGWPKSIFMLYKGGQSYDLVIEAWNSEAEYKAKYLSPVGTLVVKQIGTKYITLLNMNKNAEVDQIISTFTIK